MLSLTPAVTRSVDLDERGWGRQASWYDAEPDGAARQDEAVADLRVREDAAVGVDLAGLFTHEVEAHRLPADLSRVSF